MHEMSVARSILAVALDYLPAGANLRRVCVTVGPLHGIERGAMDWAWRALLCAEGRPHVDLDLKIAAWRVRCRSCGQKYISRRLDGVCACGSRKVTLVGGNELRVDDIEIEPEPALEPSP